MFPSAVRVSFVALLLGAFAAVAGASEVEVFTVFYQNAPAMAEKLAPLLSPEGRIAAEPKSNTIVVRDGPANIEAIRRELQRLDARQPRVRVSAGFVVKETAEGMVHWFMRTKDWSQGNVKGGESLFLGMESTPLGAGKGLSAFNRQVLLLDAGQEGRVIVSERMMEAGPLLWYGIKAGYISQQARFNELGSALGITCAVVPGGGVEVYVTPRLVRLDGGSDIVFSRERVLLAPEPGKQVALGEGKEGEGGVGELFLNVQLADGSVKKAYLILGATVE